MHISPTVPGPMDAHAMRPVFPCTCPCHAHLPTGDMPPDQETPPALPPPPQLPKAASTDLRAQLKLFRFYEKQKEHVVPIDTIICAICTNNVVTLYTTQHTYHNIKRTLASMAPMRECGFLRIHVSTVLSMAFYRGKDNDRNVVLWNKIAPQLKVSERYMADLNEFLKRNCY